MNKNDKKLLDIIAKAKELSQMIGKYNEEVKRGICNITLLDPAVFTDQSIVINHLDLKKEEVDLIRDCGSYEEYHTCINGVDLVYYKERKDGEDGWF